MKKYVTVSNGLSNVVEHDIFCTVLDLQCPVIRCNTVPTPVQQLGALDCVPFSRQTSFESIPSPVCKSRLMIMMVLEWTWLVP